MRTLLALAGLLASEPYGIQFINVARDAGFVHAFPNGGHAGKKYIIETTGSGVAWIDYDNDGFLDAFIVSGDGASNRLYRNDGKGRFRDVTREAGLERSGWGKGVCAGDYDNDGFTDLFVTYWGQNALYRNIEGKRFEDVTAKAGLTQDRVRYNTGCAFLDYDNDGHLDLFVSNYLKFDFNTTPKPGENPYCYYMKIPVNCGPRGLPFDRNILYRSNGDGTFTDVSEAAGVTRAEDSYSLGVLTGDFNGDGLIDIFVASDQTPSLLFVNKGDGTFEEDALLRGVAFDQDGKATSGMGVAAGDYDNDGHIDIFRANFSDERQTLYRNRGEGEFDDATVAAGLSHNMSYVGWGCGFADFDNDGWEDLLLVNGHVFPEIDSLNIHIRYQQRAIFYHNGGNGKLEDISESAGPAILEKHAARGAAFGDYDNDGVLEALVNNQNETPSLFKLARKPPGNWLLLKLEGVKANRSAIGAIVRLTGGGLTQTRVVRSGGSYLSQSDLRLHFGLGAADRADRIEIVWPGGNRQVEENIAANRIVTIRERTPPSPRR
ncbi:MAG: CRTAC1 family protein [Bryobacteraceae bacterium]|nr:CRTAC1 family protein [Bryobacteraceae bacterium]